MSALPAKLRVGIVDAGGANIGSVRHALRRLGVEAELADTPARLNAADRLILPGVGAAGAAMRRLNELGLAQTLQRIQTPLLGICLGMQLLYEASDEGNVELLGLVPGRVALLPASPGLRIPHMGWNALENVDSDAVDGKSLLAGIADGEQVYFVHSYAAAVDGSTVATTRHGQPFTAVMQCGSVAGAQFHPERSGTVGSRLLMNFLSGELP